MKLFLFPILLTFTLIGCNSNQEQPMTEAEYKTMIAETAAELIEADAMDATSMHPSYYQALETLEQQCSEPLVAVMNSSVDQADSIGNLGKQFAVLNILEMTAGEVSRNSEPVECAPIISKIDY
jgi:uncharacterized lipoprotein NlpE involved in copper resistance